LTTTVKTDGAYAPRAMLGAHGYEADRAGFRPGRADCWAFSLRKMKKSFAILDILKLTTTL
jgi:hypothetical protein